MSYMAILRTHYKIVSSKESLCIGEENDIFFRKLDNDFLSRETPYEMIYYNRSNGILVQEKRENYFDFSDDDVTFDLNFKRIYLWFKYFENWQTSVDGDVLYIILRMRNKNSIQTQQKIVLWFKWLHQIIRQTIEIMTREKHTH